MNRVAVFPGSFDPFTIGHHNLVTKALPLFDKVVVAMGQNSTKTPFIDPEKRLHALKSLFASEPKVAVVTFTGLTVDLCKQQGANYILRGLRNGTDFDYEKAIAHMNHNMVNRIETVFMLTEPQYENISSTIVREIRKNGGDITPWLPKGYSI
ncbi:MAG TPA: pantetheine-phosphate adenylyltransferase [Flavobacteriales bacterium]|nr:pantetheine-phosphate adenylyltransferase [Flavobacteriales bacterium]